MSIRIITNIEELAPVTDDLGKCFHEEGELPGKFSASHFLESWGNYFKLGIGAMWILELDGKIEGAFGALLYPEHYSGDVIASEAFWFVSKRARGGLSSIKMLAMFEAWSKEVGASRIMMAHLIDHEMTEKLNEFYKARGYRAVETIYVKEL